MSSSAIRARRIRRGSGERGVALFVVVMAVTLLSAVGLFAAHSATQVDQAAGYDRLARQTQQMAEYGTIATAADFGTGAAKAYLELAVSNAAASSTSTKCMANANRSGVPCFFRDYGDIDSQTMAGAGEHLLTDQSGDVPNVLGVANGSGDITGTFHSEVTDIADSGLAVPGTNLGDPNAPQYKRITVTTYAQTRPLDAANCAADTTTGTSIVTAQQAMRAHVIVGPI